MPRSCQLAVLDARSDCGCGDGPLVPKKVIYAPNEAEETSFITIKHVRARLCVARQWVWNSWHNMVATDNEYVYLSMKGPGNEECEPIED